jgi:hypothetical protein
VLEANSTDPSIITIRATRTDNGQPVPNLTQATVTTTLGSLGSVGGPTTMTVELVNGQAQVAFFPGATIGTASIRAQVNSSVGLLSINVREEGQGEVFFVSSVSPNTGSPQGGQTVTIFGGGFEDPIRVTFDGVPANIQDASTTQIRVTTPPLLDGLPAGGTRAVTVAVTIRRNTPDEATDSLPSGFVYVNGGGGGGTLQPTIFSITPASGPNEGGTQVTINGDGFEAPVQVKFGSGTTDANFNGAEAQVLSVTRTRIVVVSPPTSCASPCAPPNPNQLVNILVKNQATSRSTVATSAFRYGSQIVITAISPGEGPPAGGTLVTIFGQGFDEPVAVTMGQRAQSVISVSGSEIVVRTVALAAVACASVTGPTSVTNIETGASAIGPNFTYFVPQLSLFSATPSTGPQVGNTLVTISGANISSSVLVNFVIDSTAFAGTVQSTSASTIGARTPSIPNGSFPVETCDDNGVPPTTDPPTPNPQGQRYLPAPATIRVTDTSTGCVATLTNAFTFLPADTTCRGD